MIVMNQLTPSCDVITKKISESMDNKISLGSRILITIHLMGCKLCLRFIDQLLTMQNLIKGYNERIEKEQLKLNSEARTRIKQTLKENLNS